MESKVVLIQPPNKVLTSPTMYFPLGLLYIAAALEEAGHAVEVVDFRDKNIDFSLIPEADYYALTATTGEINDAKFISRGLKKWRKEAVTIIGGPHASILPEDCIEDFNYVVVGEGEKAIVQIMERLVAPGVVKTLPIDSLDEIPFPARHLLPEEAVFSNTLYMGEKYGLGPKSTTVISSRGCPYHCAFCGNVPQPVRFRSPENFVEEIKFLQDRYNCHHFRFVDDNFTLAKKRVLEICELLKPLKIHYRCHGRSHLLDLEMCEALKASGCEEMGLGVETADDRVLKLVEKHESVEDHKQAIRLLKEVGIRAKVYLIAGMPGESWRSIQMVKKFMAEVTPSKWTLSMFVPYPGCSIEQEPEKYGVKILSRAWEHYWNFPTKSVITNINGASNEELNQHYHELYSFLISEQWRKG